MSRSISPVRVFAAALVAAATFACSDTSTSPGQLATHDGGLVSESEGRGAFQRYVAIGTSVSQGWASDGVLAASQEHSWPAQLARLAHREITQPYISGFGCRSPLKAPLASGVRVSGEAAGANPATLSCAPNEDGVELPTQNLAVNAATTRDALYTTPENVTDPSNGQMYPRILPPGETQISALEAQNPKIVSVEFGANEVLQSRTGVAIAGVRLFPVSAWKTLYTTLVNRAAAGTQYGLLVGLIDDVADFPAFRRGAELYADRAAFAVAFNVTVAADCDGSENLLFVPVRVPVAVGTGLAMRRAGAGPYTLSCMAGPATFPDYVLTPAEAAIVNAQMAEMSAYVRAEAERLGFAHTELNALYGREGLKAPFSVVQLMTGAAPYGAYISLDGMHPSAEGQRVIAEAAARALDDTYGFGIMSQSSLIASR
jgi:hypothetical protein